MAIDENQKYMLKGSQIEDIVRNIKNGSSETVFYASSSESGTTRHIYKDTSFTVPATAQEVSSAAAKGEVSLRYFNISTPTQFNEVILANVWQSPSDNDYQFVFIGDGTSYTYAADALTDNSFYFSNAPFMFGNRVQTTGTSTTDVMSQNAVTSMVYNDPGTKKNIVIGGGTIGSATDPVVIGRAASVRGNYAIAIGSAAGSQVTNAPGAISLGAFSEAGVQGQMDISLASATSQAKAANGYAGSGYRLLTGLYDPQSAHDAATKGYVDTVASAITMTTTDPGEGSPLAENHFIGVYNA